MEHITEEYGQETNLLKLTRQELDALEPFLRAIGVRVRTCRSFCGDCVVQAENPYKSYAYITAFSANCGRSVPADYVRRRGDDAMTDREIAAYKR